MNKNDLKEKQNYEKENYFDMSVYGKITEEEANKNCEERLDYIFNMVNKKDKVD